MSEVTTSLRSASLPQRGEHLGLGPGVGQPQRLVACGSSWAPPGRSARRASPRRGRRASSPRPRGAGRGGDRRTWWRGSGRASRSPGGVGRSGPPLSPALQRCLTPVVLWPERFRGGCTFGARPHDREPLDGTLPQGIVSPARLAPGHFGSAIPSAAPDASVAFRHDGISRAGAVPVVRQGAPRPRRTWPAPAVLPPGLPPGRPTSPAATGRARPHARRSSSSRARRSRSCATGCTSSRPPSRTSSETWREQDGSRPARGHRLAPRRRPAPVSDDR